MYLSFNAVHNGACLELARHFDPAEVVRALDERDDGVGIAMAPTMIQACLAAEGVRDRKFRNLRWILYGAAPISTGLLQEAIDVFGCDFVQGFGQTEVSAICWLLPSDHLEALDGKSDVLKSVGRITMGVDVRLVDPFDVDVPPGDRGEIIVRTDMTMRCYWNSPELTAETQRGGWHHTGDVGYFDQDGYLYVVDRIKDVIISGGYNVYSREVEAVLERMPEVAQVAVIGVPDEHWGEEVKAVVRLAPGASLSADEIIGRCRDELAGFKVPKSVDFVDEFPINATGKILKTVLRSRYGPVDGTPRRPGA
jgi:acyl-CoA synthetase (AMP-forming)/AMP-acid ligase II